MANLLVIDDDNELATLLSQMLERVGHNVLTANSGEQGIAVANKQPIDAIVLDVMMPDMDGYEVARRLRQMDKTKNLPILILSARAQPIDQQMALDAGANAFLAKPASPQSLTAKVDELLTIVKPDPGTSQQRIINVMGLRDGVGKSTFAVNLALALIRTHHRACLVELTASGSQLMLHLGLRAGPGWSLIKDGINAENIGKAMIKHPSGLFVMLSPPKPQRDHLTAERFGEMITTLHTTFNDIVIDSADWTDPATREAATQAAVTFVLLTPEVTAVHSTLNTLAMLEGAGVLRSSIHLVLNHTNPRPDLSRAAVEKALGRPVKVSLPYDPAQPQALMKGGPLILTNPGQPYISELGKAFGAL